MKILGAIENIETIAKGRGIREYAQLVVQYGSKNWMKRKGTRDCRTGRANCTR